jgi:MSHA biogenesis protein MshQ
MKCFRVRERLRLGILAALLVCAGAWPCFAATETVLDTFSVVSYGNQDGTANWSTDWVEYGDDDSPDSGRISVDEDSDRLRIRGRNNENSSAGIRRGADLSQATLAVLSFDYERTSFNSWWDEVEVEVSADGGGNWTSLVSIDWWSSYTGSWSGDISGYATANTWIRFVRSGSLSSNERVYVDNVQIEYQVPDAPQLVAHYALEGNVDDSSGNGHDGSSQGMVAYQRARVCDGVQLDGSGYLQVPDNDDFDLSDELTVMAWIRADSLSVSGHDDLYSFLSKDTNSEFHVRSNGTLYWWWGNGSLSSAAGLIAPQTWYHFAAVYSRSAGTMWMYLNGVPVASRSFSSLLPVNDDPFFIGTDKSTGGGEMPLRRFIGAIDEVRVFNEALSAGEIVDLMNEADPCALPEPLAEWRFDECDYEGMAPLAEDAQGSYDAVAQGDVESEPAGVVGRAAMLDLSTDSFLTNSDVPMNGDWTVSTWFRMPFTHTEGSRYHVLGSMAGGGNDLLWVDSNRGYLWGGWAGSTSQDGSFRFSTLPDGWHHLTAVAENGQTNLYIDGVWRDRVSLQPSGNLHFVATSYDSVGGNQGFRADLDEFLVFDGALTETQISSIYQLQSAGRNLDGTVREEIVCGPAIDHFELIHDGSALTCAPEEVTVRACTDADCSNLYTDPVDIVLSPSGWVGGDSGTISGGSGVFLLRHTTPGVVSLSVTGNPTADHGPQCVDGAGGSSCDLVFHEAGFLFDVPALTSCGLEENILIAAVRADATAEHCVGDDSFAGTARNVAFWSDYQEPATGTLPVVVNGQAVAGADPGTPVSLNFDAQAESLLAVRYSDAGRVRLSARFVGSGEEAGLVMEGSDSFVAAPHHLRVVATTDGTTPLDNATSSGLPSWKAGEDFSIEVAGVCADGSVTLNFAAETTFNAIAANPAAGVFTGGPLAAGDYSGGTATGTAAYSEVGTVTLQAEAADYLGSGIDVIGSAVIGRFTPDHFDVSLNNPVFATACDGGFTYIGEAFGYAVAPVITVTAKNRQGGTTENYAGEWWKIDSTTLTGKTYSSATGTIDISGLPAADPVISVLGGGMGLLTFDAGGGLRFVRNAPTAPFDAEISLAIDVLDADGIAATANPVTFGEAAAGNGIPFDSGKAMRWGRLSLKNAYGSELLALPMALRAEYFDGSAFVRNPDDGCTSLALTQLTLNNGTTSVSGDQPVAVGTGSSSATLLSPMVAGDAGLSFSAPGDDGFIDVQLDLSLLPWLRYDWDGDGLHDNDPQGRATFGIYKSRPSLIYRRETYRGSP